MSLEISFEAPAETGINASLNSGDSIISESFSAISAQISEFTTSGTGTALHEPVQVASNASGTNGIYTQQDRIDWAAQVGKAAMDRNTSIDPKNSAVGLSKYNP